MPLSQAGPALRWPGGSSSGHTAPEVLPRGFWRVRARRQRLFPLSTGVGNNNDGTLVLGATNIPWVLDSAIRRR